MRNICIILLLLFFTCCQNEVQINNGVSKQEKYSVYFSNYLKKQFNLQIPKEQHFFVIVPSKGCPSCVKKEAQDFLNLINKPNTTLIVAGTVKNALPLADNVQARNLLIDEDNFIDKQNLPFPDFTGIYKTEKGEITEIIPFSFETYQQAFSRL